MAASQVEAMKKTYAAVMLNMAQESAARVLEAERRAAVLEGRLVAAKDDGVAMLVRLKAIMEARIKEVELRSSRHVKKIKELEAQLQSLQHSKMKELEEQLYGAQNNVAALQSELQVANTKLENTRKTLAEERMNRFPTNKKMDSNATSSCLKMSLQSGTMSIKNDKTAEENGATQNTQSIYHQSSLDLPSFMERNKKPKLYHNGGTQRIHALKQNQGADACQEQNHKHGTRLNSRSKTRKKDAPKNPCQKKSIMEQLLGTKFLGQCKRKRGSRSRTCYDHDSSGEIREAEFKIPDTSDGNGCYLLLKALDQDPSLLKVSAEHGGDSLTDLKDDSLMNRRDAGQNFSTASPEPDLIDILASKNKLVKKRKRTKTVSVLEAEFSDLTTPEPDNTVLRSTSDKNMSDTELISEMKDNDSDTPPGSTGPVMQHSYMNLMCQDDANKGQLESGNSSALLLSCKTEVMDYGNLLVEQSEPYSNSACLKEANGDGNCGLGQLESADSSALLLQSYKTEDMDCDNLLVEQSKQEAPYNKGACLKEANGEGSCSLGTHKAGTSTIISLKKEEKIKASSGLPMQASEKPDASVGSSRYKEEHAKASSGASIRVEGARQIKFTFNRRKHKCVSAGSTPLCADKSSKLLSAPKEGEPHPNAEQQDILIDSPQCDNQLVQIARQLISLSERN